MAAVGFTIPGNPGEFRKGDSRIIYPDVGKLGRCTKCKHPLGRSCIVQAELSASLRGDIQAAAFQGALPKHKGLTSLGVLARWPGKWETSRAPGRPRGDVDAPISNLLDGLAGILYGDDAQVGLLVAMNALGTKATAGIDIASPGPPSPALLAALTAEFRLPFDTARLTLGAQERLTL